MDKSFNVPLRVIKRLPVYYRTLCQLKKGNEERISSSELSKLTGFTAPQIRQDFGYFGELGRNGYGYNVLYLYQRIGEILGMDKFKDAIILGAGNLARALISHSDFFERGINLKGVFDKDKRLSGKIINGYKIMHIEELEEFCSKQTPHLAILCIEESGARRIAPLLISYGIKGFWNFSNYDIKMEHKDVAVENVYLNDSLMTLCCLLNNSSKKSSL